MKNYDVYVGDNNFCFLNLQKPFDVEIDWDFSEFGKLWTYNLNYFDFLNQETTSKHHTEYNELINDFILKLPKLKNANEPFPSSLRIINWIIYITIYNINDNKFLRSLYSQLYILNDNKEYNLLGNHLLENGFALLFGGVFFQDKYLFQQGKIIVFEQLEEQILNDGAHFELSPMYHCLMLRRVLDSLNLFRSNSTLINSTLGDQNEFEDFLQNKAQMMCGWLQAILYEDGSYPHFNDSTDGIALKPKDLLNFAQNIGLNISVVGLKDSGFRRFKNTNFDSIIKAGNIGPDYIPGHAHADSLSFECRIKNEPFITDNGISTYEKNEIRQLQRSTVMHNTVSLKKGNSSKVWGGFRVAQRANTFITKEDKCNLVAYHNGYGKNHYRHFMISDNEYIIYDKIESNTAAITFHFHPDIDVEKLDCSIITNIAVLKFEDAKKIDVSDYQYCLGFNKMTKAKKVLVVFENSIKTKIII